MNPWVTQLPVQSYLAVKVVKQVAPKLLARTYCAKRLLEHGGLEFGQFVSITGWPRGKASQTLQKLQKHGIARAIRKPGTRQPFYELVS